MQNTKNNKKWGKGGGGGVYEFVIKNKLHLKFIVYNLI